MTEQFDVFLCHNSADKPQVRKIAEQLMQYDLKPWLDMWELPPGRSWQMLLERQIEKIRSAAVFVGGSGFGPWQQQELYAFLSEFVDRNCPVIPVLLPNAPGRPELPLFLRQFTWVDFRTSDPDPMYQLRWGITGKKPDQQTNFKDKNKSPSPQVSPTVIAEIFPKNTIYQAKLESVLPIESISNTDITPFFLENCKRELTCLIGPIASFIVDDTFSDNPKLTQQQFIELIITEIPDPKRAKLFKQVLLESVGE
jgi:hypothetical protein